MGLILLVVFIGVPLIEIGLFIEVGSLIGLWPTIAVVVLTAIVGTALLRHQGLSALTRLQNSLENGEPPIDPVFDGFCLLAAGLMLLTPGFFTDTVGFLLFVPPVRSVLKRLISRRLQVNTRGTTSQDGFHWHASTFSKGSPKDDIIDGEYQDVTDKKERPRISHPDDL